MDYLGPGYEGASPQAVANIFVERLKNAGDVGDRRNALDSLLRLSEDHPTDVGVAGMPIFTDILQAGIADGAMTQTIMGIMLNLVKDTPDGHGAVDNGANVSSFLQDVQNVQNLLDLLESPDTLTALSAVQVLQALQKSSAESLEDRILECPAGLQALVEILRDPREEIRNEVILLLRQLTSNNLEVKKFVAFQEGFERLFDIMSSEGMLEGGGVVVKDCLEVCLNLLVGSSLTKALLCQSRCLKVFHQLIDVRTAEIPESSTTQEVSSAAGDGPDKKAEAEALHADPSSKVEMQTEIACKALDVLLLLLSGDGDEEEGKRAERQSVVAGAEEGMLSEMLAHVAFSRAETFCRSPIKCQERAMRATGALVDRHPTNQYNMGELLVQDVGLESVSLATLVIEGALRGGGDQSLKETRRWVLGCFFHGNELGCTQIVSHVIAPPPPPLELEDLEAWVPPIPPGKVLIDGLTASAQVLFYSDGAERAIGDYESGSDVRGAAAAHTAGVVSRGCMILSMLLEQGGSLAKEIALRVPVSPEPGSHATTLLHALLRWLELVINHPLQASATPAVQNSATTRRIENGDAGGDEGGENRAISEAQAVSDVGLSLLRLLCGWVHGCPAAVRELLDNPANLFVVDVAAGRDSIMKTGSVNDNDNDRRRKSGSFLSVQRAAMKGFACLLLGLLLEYVEGAADAPRSDGGQWTRDVVMKMIQNRIGMSPFMASIEATKRAFSEAETAQRRRHRAARERKGSTRNGQALDDGGEEGLRLDPAFIPLLQQASEEVRRRVIAILTLGGGGGGDGGADDGLAEGNEDGVPGVKNANQGDRGTAATGAGPGLASMVELQEREITGLREELSKALSRIPRGGGEGGISALEEGLRNKVGDLEDADSARTEEMNVMRAQLQDALEEAKEERQSGTLLASELEGLSITVSSLERQLSDRETECEGLRRQLDNVDDRSEREKDLAKEVQEARSRASNTEEALVTAQRQIAADAMADEAAREATVQTEAEWKAKVQHLEAALDKAAAAATAAAADAAVQKKADADFPADETASSALATKVEELEESRKALMQVERVLADKTGEVEGMGREIVMLREAVEAATLRCAAAEDRATEETRTLRQQLENAVRSLAEASSGGDQQVEALQKELSAVSEREEREAVEWRRRLDGRDRQAKEEMLRLERLFAQTEERLNEQWALEVEKKEAVIARLEEEASAGHDAAEALKRTSSEKAIRLEEDSARLRAQAERAEALEARCARLEEAAASAGADAERRLRDEMERDRQSARGVESSVIELTSRLDEASLELSEKGTTIADLRRRLDEAQAYLRQSEDDREAAEGREVAALLKAKDSHAAVRAVEEKMKDVMADLEDRDNVIAAVEDARAAQEREAESLRDRLRGLGKLSPQITGGATRNGYDNGNIGTSSPVGNVDGVIGHGGDDDRNMKGEEYLELLSEHEDLLQLLAQQEIVRKKLLNALRENSGQVTARAVMEDAEAEVEDTYGGFLRYTDEEEDTEYCNGTTQSDALAAAAAAGPVSGRRVAV